MNTKVSPNLVKLPRGGLVVDTDAGRVQFGAPPETIKDTLPTEGGVPRTFILPPEMFSLEGGFSLAELEFPVYYNFFFKQRTIRVICTRPQQERLLTVLKEALFGPAHLDYEGEFVNGRKTPGYPDLAAEMMNFRTIPIQGKVRPMELEDVVEFYLAEPGRPVHLDTLTIALDEENTYTVKDSDGIRAEFRPDMDIIPEKETDFGSRHVFYPPLFGITTLGSGHGFAPDAMTSGMILWINRRGIMVDPPVNAAIELVRLGVSPKVLDSIILTHCHADHDAGTLQKIMQEGSITLYSTPTVFNSFIRKSSALTNIPEDLMKKSVRFVSLPIGTPVNINGGMFRFNYSLHSIPTISIQAEFGGRNMVYSSDTHNDPVFADQLFEKGVVDENRRDFLKDFPWDRDIIFHEAGIPPLHTPMKVLTALPADIRERMYLVHVTNEMIPEGSGLKIAPTGLSSTLELDVAPPEFSRPVEILGTYLDQPLFASLPPEKTMEFLCISQTRHCKPGTVIVRKGNPGQHFYVIMTGQVEVSRNGTLLTTFGRGDFFGEKCLFSDIPRTATVTAKSDVRLIILHKEDMLAFIRNTPVEDTLFHLASVQNKQLRDLLNLNPIFRSLTPSQKTQIFQILVPVPSPEAGELIRQGDPPDACYFLTTGHVRVSRDGVDHTTLGPGALFGIRTIFDGEAPSSFSFTANPDAVLLRMAKADLDRFAQNNPGVFLKLYRHAY
ncbi:MAG: cAMP/cGMP-dependent 3',5'-cyclic-AMP/GMP phosphodiesterase [Desulfobacterales bacterium]|nr:cAMP/cGMP-dependent 3',5'-cyclic-AMP/GMP phosphodiesterase [Desulfobacterales bacterium]